MTTITYEADATPVHALDARAKLVFQIGFAVAAFAQQTPAWLAGVGLLAVVALALSRLSPIRVLSAYWFVFVLLGSGVVFQVVTLGPPWIRPVRAVDPSLQVASVAFVLFVSAAYVRTTPVRETRAAIQRHVPGRLGLLLGVGVALTFRFIPVLRRDLETVIEAMRARLGNRRGVVDRARRIGITGLSRAFTRADRLSLALRARCFAWNPTLPALRYRRRDYLVTALGLALAASPLLVAIPGRFIPIG
jgi:biotin transport system permease protein